MHIFLGYLTKYVDIPYAMNSLGKAVVHYNFCCCCAQWKPDKCVGVRVFMVSNVSETTWHAALTKVCQETKKV